MEAFNILNALAITLLSIIGGIWTFYKLFYKYKSKVLFITNCQILHKKVWEAMLDEESLKIEKHGEEDFAFRPLVLLPHSMKKYTDIKNGKKAVLESVNTKNENNLKIVAEIFWIPEHMKPWCNTKHPLFSLLLRRYFGIERPMYQDEKDKDMKDTDWKPVSHCADHLNPLNRFDKGKNVIRWAVSKSYTFRFFNPFKGTYHKDSTSDNFIEYCGLSIVLRKRSIIQSDKD